MSEKSGCQGCLIWGSAIGVFLLVIVVIAVFALVHRARTWAESFTDTEPQEVEIVEVTPEELQNVQQKMAGLKQAVEQGQPYTLRLSALEINQLIAGSPDMKEMKGRVAVAIENEMIKAKVSVPLDKLPVPGMKGRYLNGDAELLVSCTSGMLNIQAKRVVVNGEPLPEAFMQGIRGENLAKSMYDDPDMAAKLRHIQSVRIEENELVIETSQPQ